MTYIILGFIGGFVGAALCALWIGYKIGKTIRW